jgi:hypothetical protein
VGKGGSFIEGMNPVNGYGMVLPKNEISTYNVSTRPHSF